ncbi:hypothetical protein ES707_00149 [subsurface metagenome]
MVGEGEDLLPSALGNLPSSSSSSSSFSSSFSFSMGVVKGEDCSVLGSALAGALGNLLGSNSLVGGGQFSVIISFGVGW